MNKRVLALLACALRDHSVLPAFITGDWHFYRLAGVCACLCRTGLTTTEAVRFYADGRLDLRVDDHAVQSLPAAFWRAAGRVLDARTEVEHG